MSKSRPSPISGSRPRTSVSPRIAPALEIFTSHPDLWFAVASACWVMLLYRHVLGAAFVYDDVPQIQKNAALTSWHSVLGYFRSEVPFSNEFRGFGGSFYRPLFWFSLAVDRAVYGLNANGYHVTNLLLHWANGFLAFLLLKRLRISTFVAAVVGFTWLGLPINTEVVAWISGRPIALAFLFVLLSLLSAEWYLRANQVLPLLGYAIASLASLLSHEIGILTLPLTCVLAYATKPALRRWLVLSSVGLTTDAIYLWLRHLAGAHLSLGSPTLIEFASTFWKYVVWILLPLRMSVERSTDVPTDSSLIATAAAFVGFMALVILAARLRDKMPEVSAGLACLCIALAPFCGVLPIYQGMAERYAYVAGLALVLATAALVFRIRNRARVLAFGAVIGWVFWGALRLNARVLDWRDEVLLYASSLNATPRSAVLLYNLGAAYAEEGRGSAAADYYRRAIALKPDYTAAMVNLGNLFEHEGNYSEAASFYKRAISIDPRDPDVWVNLGDVYLQLSLIQEAESAYARAINLKPNDVDAIINLGAARQLSGNFAGATQAYQRAIAVDPNQAVAYCDLGAALLQHGNTEAAREQLTKAIEHNPAYAPAYFDFGVLYERTGQRDRAIEMYQKALQLQPDYQRALTNLERLQSRR